MPHLIFDFPDPATGGSRRTVFRNPEDVVQADSPDQVRSALDAVEAAVERGLHAAGFVAYEAAPGLTPVMRVRTPGRPPLVWFGLFGAPAWRGESPAPRPAALPDAGWRLEPDRERHAAGITAIREAIAEGRSYQVNYTARLSGRLDATDPAPLYDALRWAQGAGYHALLDLGRDVFVSASPELFFRTHEGAITMRPMKGTRPRGRWPEEDQALATELRASPKDRAENLMIVDLVRSDLGRVCRTGTVRTPELLELERYHTVWQLTSSVTGELRDDVGLSDLLAALFPCGSVTGAPKISTMELIARLETAPRGVYCGAIGMIAPGGERVFNVPIRTLSVDRETGAAEYGAGGGVVWDSTAAGEYRELLSKAAIVREPWPDFALLETMSVRDGGVPRLERHLARLAASARHFAFPFPEAGIRRRIGDAARAGGEEPLRLRLTLARDGTVDVQSAPLGSVGGAGPDVTGEGPLPRVALAAEPVSSRDPFLFHKTTYRDVYDRRRSAARGDLLDVLLRNERDEITESTRANLVVELDGRLLTPSRAAGLLAGCLRAELLEAGAIREATLRPSHLFAARRLWLINSARGWTRVELEPTP